MADDTNASDEPDRTDAGYHDRFTVIRTATGEEIDERTFTLIPSHDPAARVALAAYAEAARELDGNDELHDDLTEWLDDATSQE